MSDEAPKRSAICFLTRQAAPELLSFVNQMTSIGEDVYVMNDFGGNPAEFECTCISKGEARTTGFWGVNCVDWIPKDLMALDKALYYFCKKDTEPDYIWFVEDDVFVPRPDIFRDIDAKYPDADLLTKSNLCQMECTDWPGWNRADLSFMDGGPFYHSLCCAMRLSRRMLQAVQEFAETKGRLVFLEFFFNTLAMQKGFKVETPEELSTIVFEQRGVSYFYHKHIMYIAYPKDFQLELPDDFTDEQFNEIRVNYFYDKNHLYHSIKDYQTHELLRTFLFSDSS